MEKQIHPYNGILKEEPSDRHLPQYEWISKIRGVKEARQTRRHSASFHLQEISRQGKTIEAESRPVVAEGGSED